MVCTNTHVNVCRCARSILYWIMTEELVIRGIRIDETAIRGDPDSQMTSFEVFICHLNSNHLYESPTVICVALSQLVIRK